MKPIAMWMLIGVAALLLSACPNYGPHMGGAGYGGHMSGYPINGSQMYGR